MRWFLLLVLLVGSGCATPQEKAVKRVMRDYRRASADCAARARQQVAHLTAAAQAFRKAHARWPHMLDELAGFAYQNKIPFDDLAFSESTFASLADGSLQIHYEINCVRFDITDQKLVQRGSVNIKPR